MNKENNFYKKVVEQISDALLILDKKQKIIYVNEKFLKITNSDAQEISGKSIQFLYSKFKHTGILKTFSATISTMQTQSSIIVLENREFLLKTSIIDNMILAFFHNIDKQRKLEKALEKTIKELSLSQQYNKNLLNSSMDMIIAVDNDRKIITFNHSAQETFGYSEEEIIGKHVKILYHSHIESIETHKEVLRSGQTIREVTNIRKNGEPFISNLATAEILDESGKRLGIMGISRDISKQRQQEEEVKLLKSRLSSRSQEIKVLGTSSEITKVLDQIEMVAPTNMTVIVQGESGTGKELVSSLLHKRSDRSDSPYIAVDCGAIPDTLIESELFGHEKGAFTGADCRKAGVFERAHGGTLLLDEITNLNTAAQTKLLRVLQERKFTRIGGTKTIKFDTRIIAASNIKMNEAVKNGDFRLDLYHRLNEFQLELPLLRNRKDDIPILADYFLQSANVELGKIIKGYTRKATKVLLNYDWPGNVREFRNIIRRAVLLCNSEHIDENHLIIDTDIECEQSNSIDQLNSGKGLKEITSEQVEKMEKEIIIYALNKAEGNKSKAAKLLNIERVTLYSKLRYYNLRK